MPLINLSSPLYTNNSYISLFNKNQSTKSENQESNETNPTQRGQIEQKITDMLQRGFKDEEIALYANHQKHPILMQQDGDGLEQLQKFLETTKNLKNNVSLPTESEFQTSLNHLTKELHSILTNFYEKEPDSEEFKNLLGYALTVTSEIEERENDKQQLLNLLNQAQRDPEFAKSQEFMDKLLLTASTNSINDNQINALLQWLMIMATLFPIRQRMLG